MIMSSDVLVMIPTLNEALAIRQTVEDVLEWVPNSQVVVIDNRSEDDTAKIAKRAGAIILNVPRCGKGFAIRTTLPNILANYACKRIIMLDGDFTYPAKHIPRVLEELGNGADVVLGYRAVCEQRSMTQANAIGNRGLSLLASLLYRKLVRDVCTGMWGFRKDVLERFVITSNRFTLEADLFVNAARNRCRISQIPIGYKARQNGSTSKLGLKDGLEIGWFLIRSRFS